MQQDSGLDGGLMRAKSVIAMLMGGLLGSGLGMTYAADPMAEKEATPTIKERLTKLRLTES